MENKKTREEGRERGKKMEICVAESPLLGGSNVVSRERKVGEEACSHQKIELDQRSEAEREVKSPGWVVKTVSCCKHHPTVEEVIGQ